MNNSLEQLIRDLQMRPWSELEENKDKAIATLINVQAKLNAEVK